MFSEYVFKRQTVGASAGVADLVRETSAQLMQCKHDSASNLRVPRSWPRGGQERKLNNLGLAAMVRFHADVNRLPVASRKARE
jgi:hypothetical protein